MTDEDRHQEELDARHEEQQYYDDQFDGSVADAIKNSPRNQSWDAVVEVVVAEMAKPDSELRRAILGAVNTEIVDKKSELHFLCNGVFGLKRGGVS